MKYIDQMWKRDNLLKTIKRDNLLKTKTKSKLSILQKSAHAAQGLEFGKTSGKIKSKISKLNISSKLINILKNLKSIKA